jgi:hypothetical protein
MRQNRTLRLFRYAVFLAILTALPAGVLDVSAAPSAMAQQTGDDALLHTLAARLATMIPLGPDGKPLTVRLLPGQLPPDFRVMLPIPSDSSVIGSAVRQSSNGATVGATVILDVPESPDAILDFYNRAMTAAEFAAPSNLITPGSQGGFQQSFQVQSRYFCQGRNGPSVSILVYPQINGPTDVHINADTTGAGPCSIPGPLLTGTTTLPTLTAPAGVVVQFGQPGSPVPVLSGSSRSDATAITDMSVADLEAWYAGQLEQAGWTPLVSNSDATLAWTTFNVPDQSNAQGFLYVLAGPGTNRRILHLDVTTVPGS